MNIDKKGRSRVTVIRDQATTELENFIYMLIDSYTIITIDDVLRKCTETFIDRLNEISPAKFPKGEELKEVYTVYVTEKKK